MTKRLNHAKIPIRNYLTNLIFFNEQSHQNQGLKVAPLLKIFTLINAVLKPVIQASFAAIWIEKCRQ